MVESLEIDGFRGYQGAFEWPARGRAVLLLGGQGAGKTSCLGAVEWCLFGRLAYFKSAESKTDLELVNSHKLNEMCRVKMVLRKDSKNFEIERIKEARTRDTQLSVRSDGEEFDGSDAQEKIITTLGLTFDDFYRSVYLHQEAIRGLVTDDPRHRDEAIDRLLGLDTARNLLNGIPVKDVKDAITELTTKKEKLETKISGATTQLQADLDKAEAEAASEDLEDKDLSLECARILVVDLDKHLSKLAIENQLDREPLPDAVDVPSLAKAVTRSKAFAKECRNKVIEVTNVDALRHRRDSIADLQEGLERLSTQLAEQAAKMKQISSAVGDKKKIKSSIELENLKIAEFESRRSRFDAMSKLASDALSLFSTSLPTVCPVCEQQITPEKVKTHLKELLEDSTQRQLAEIDEGVGILKRRIDELQEAGKRLDESESRSRELYAKRVELLKKASEILGEQVSEELAPSRLNQESAKIKEGLKEAVDAYKRRNEQIDRAEEVASRIKVIHKVLEKRQEFAVLNERFSAESGEIGGLKEAIGNLSKLQHRLEDIVEAVSTVQVELAEESVRMGSDEMEKVYSILRAHPYYSKLKIDVSAKTTSGIAKNTYLIRAFNPKDGKDTFVSGRFSTGQMNCAALSIFIALAKMASHNLGFVIFDDPSQNLDSHHKGAVCDVLEEIAGEKQLIIGTQDEELQERLRKVFKPGAKAIIAEFGEWSKNGPTIALSG